MAPQREGGRQEPGGAPCFLQEWQPRPPSCVPRGWCWERSQVSAVQPRWICRLSQAGMPAVMGMVLGKGWQGVSLPMGCQHPLHGGAQLLRSPALQQLVAPTSALDKRPPLARVMHSPAGSARGARVALAHCGQLPTLPPLPGWWVRALARPGSHFPTGGSRWQHAASQARSSAGHGAGPGAPTCLH